MVRSHLSGGRWFQYRREAEQFYGIADGMQVSCKGPGVKNYVSMDIQRARLPRLGEFMYEVRRNVIADDSPDRFNPIAESKYTSTNYN